MKKQTASPGGRKAKESALKLLSKADAFAECDDWARSLECADQVIAVMPELAAAYETRALAHRNLCHLEAAIADYGRTIELDPHNYAAWMLRGACRAERASGESDHARAMALLAEAHPDYRRASELNPDSEQTGLALLELEICIGKYLDAVGTTGEWWGRIRRSELKVVCAWLGAIAMILAGRPERRWAHLRDFLQTNSRQIESSDWCLVEIDHHLKFAETQPGVDLTQVKIVHELFLGHIRGIETIRRG